MEAKQTIIGVALLGMLFFSACRKESVTEPIIESKKMNELVVPADFKWESTIETMLTINTQMTESIGQLVKVSVYDANPVENGNLLATGSAGFDFPYAAKIRIPSNLKQLYVQVTGAKGTIQIVPIVVSGNMTYTFVEPDGGYKNGLKNTQTEPDCSGDFVISGSANVTIKNGKTYVVSDTYTGEVSYEWWNGGGTLKVCGTATLSKDITMGNNCHIVVTSTGTLTSSKKITLDGAATFTAYSSTTVQIKELILNMTTTSFTNYSDSFTLQDDFKPNGSVYNYGNLIVENDLTQTGNIFSNEGTITVSGKFEINKNLTNSGSISATGNVAFNNATVVNSCKIVGGINVEVNATSLTMNNGLIQLAEKFSNNGGSTITMNNQSMISCKRFDLNSGITGGGSQNSIKVSQQTNLNSTNKVNGAIELADQTGSLNNGSVAGNFSNGATFVSWANISNYIPTSPCNPLGIGVPTVVDVDGDGVADNLDAYPTDPTRAYNSFFPNENTWGSLAFEDLWPAKGDYDFNDLVTKYQFKLVTNAQNNVVDIIGQFQVTAVGASFKNGFGIQFDGVTPEQVATVTGCVIDEGYLSMAENGTENGQEKAVIIPWDNADNVIHRAGGSMFNTVENGFVGTSDVVTVNIHFVHALTSASVGTPPFNTFIIRDMVRGHEIHLIDKVPTTLMDVSLFGTDADASIPSLGQYFRTSNNLPWGISIPEVFAHPIEKAEVTSAHLKFSEWAQSGGSLYPDWYMDKPGYRNDSFIYEP